MKRSGCFRAAQMLHPGLPESRRVFGAAKNDKAAGGGLAGSLYSQAICMRFKGAPNAVGGQVIACAISSLICPRQKELVAPDHLRRRSDRLTVAGYGPENWHRGSWRGDKPVQAGDPGKRFVLFQSIFRRSSIRQLSDRWVRAERLPPDASERVIAAHCRTIEAAPADLRRPPSTSWRRRGSPPPRSREVADQEAGPPG